MTEQQQELYDERVAILIYEAGFTESDAKRLALKQMFGAATVK